MGKSSFSKILRLAVSSCYSEKNGVVIRNNRIGNFKVHPKSVPAWRELIKLAMETGYFKRDVKKYLQGQSVENISNDRMEKKATTKSRINYQLGRLKQELGEDAMLELLESSDEIVISRHKKKIHELLKEYEKKSLLDNIMIRIPTYDGREVKSLEEDVLESMYYIIGIYAKKIVRGIEGEFTADMVAYVHYLEEQNKEEELTEEEEANFKRLVRLLEE